MEENGGEEKKQDGQAIQKPTLFARAREKLSQICRACVFPAHYACSLYASLFFY
jgi:hypothetical protein